MRVLHLPVAHHPDSGSWGEDGAHAPASLVVAIVSHAWEQTLRDLGDDVLLPSDVAVVRVACDYRHEVFVAPAEFEVGVVRIGRTSVELAVRVRQGGRLVVEAQVVAVHVDADRTGSVPLSERQRAALETIAVAEYSPAG